MHPLQFCRWYKTGRTDWYTCWEKWNILYMGKNNLMYQSWKAALQKKKNGMKECSRKGWRWVSNMPLQQISPTAFLTALRKVFPGQGSYYLYYAPARLHLEYVFNSGLPSTRIMWTCWSKSSKGPLRSWRDCSTFHMRKDWEILDCLALKKKVQEEPYWWVWMSE